MKTLNNSTRLDLINLYMNLEPGTALVVSIGETSSSELSTSATIALEVEDIPIIKEALSIFTDSDIYDFIVLQDGDEYITHNYQLIAIKDKTIHTCEAE